MYERLVFHAIQNDKLKDFSSRYRMYTSRAERDKTFDLLKKKGHGGIDSMTCVTLTIIAETVDEQLTLGDL